MPITHRFIEGHPLVLIRLAGPCSGTEVADTIRAVAADARLVRGATLLWDGRELTHLSVAPREVEATVAAQRELEARTGPGRSAVVVTRPEDDLIARLFVRVIDSAERDIRVFADLDEARAWLGVEGVPF